MTLTNILPSSQYIYIQIGKPIIQLPVTVLLSNNSRTFNTKIFFKLCFKQKEAL